MNKKYSNVVDVLTEIEDGAVIAVPGFFAAGVPRSLLRGLIKSGIKDIVLACGCGPMLGASDEMVELVENKQIKKVIDSYGLYRSATKGSSDPFEQAVKEGEIEYEVYPMGTLAEKYRAAGSGIPAFYTPTGVGSVFEETVVTNIPKNRVKKETKEINGEKFILEYALKPDVAFIHAFEGDRDGNLRYRKTSKNFNPVMAAAATLTIAEVEHLVEPGDIKPDIIDTPGIYVQRLIEAPKDEYALTID
ncbi:MAG: CoA transferase subunit A [Desulfobacterales bacterium]|nr:CoA transferase subunit A [Desulfobacterales bacterium]